LVASTRHWSGRPDRSSLFHALRDEAG